MMMMMMWAAEAAGRMPECWCCWCYPAERQTDSGGRTEFGWVRTWQIICSLTTCCSSILSKRLSGMTRLDSA